MIPAVALKLLGRHWPRLILLAGLAFGFWYLDHRGYQRARAEAALAEAREAARTSELLRRIEAAMNARLAEIDGRLASRVAGIERTRITLQPIIEREIADDPRLADPAAGVSERMLRAINAARGAAGDPAAAGEHPPGLPAAGAAD